LVRDLTHEARTFWIYRSFFSKCACRQQSYVPDGGSLMVVQLRLQI
jgi:hypothetical protein